MNQTTTKPVRLNIKIQISTEVLRKLWFWTQEADGEFSALGEVEQVLNEKTGRIRALRVVDLHLVKQSCNESETEMDSNSVCELMQKIDTDRLRIWVHSHGKITVFWSATDEKCIAGLGDWMLSLVVNKKHDALLRLDQFIPCHLCVDNLDWEMYFPEDKAVDDSLRAEFKKNVLEESWHELLKPNADRSVPLSFFDPLNPDETPDLEDLWLTSELERREYER